jgi:anti-sigma factor RsiW
LRHERVLHPERLPWFASGRLDVADAAEIERHVNGCESCRAEVAALRSMYRSLRDGAPSGHVSPTRLVAYHARDPQFSRDDRRIIEEHVRGCPTCSADLSALERSARSTRARHGRRMLEAAAAVLIVVTLGWQIAVRRGESPSPPAVTHVAFSPTQRGTTADPRLVGAGPWELEVWLPLRAQARDYRARIERSGDPSSVVVDRVVTAGPQGGSVLLRVPGGLPSGHYLLTLSSLDGAGSERVVHGFDVGGPR